MSKVTPAKIGMTAGKNNYCQPLVESEYWTDRGITLLIAALPTSWQTAAHASISDALTKFDPFSAKKFFDSLQDGAEVATPSNTVEESFTFVKNKKVKVLLWAFYTASGRTTRYDDLDVSAMSMCSPDTVVMNASGALIGLRKTVVVSVITRKVRS